MFDFAEKNRKGREEREGFSLDTLRLCASALAFFGRLMFRCHYFSYNCLMLRKLIVILSLLGLIISLLPYATSLYDLTGEEGWPGQLAGIVHWVNTAVRPQPHLAVDAAAATAVAEATAVSPFGMNTFLQSEVEPEKRARSLQLIHDAGFRYIRQEFTWEDIEIHGKGDFTDRRNDLDGDGQIDEVDAWAKYDNIVDLAEQSDVTIIARLGNPPAWTRALTNTIGTYAPPDDFNDYGDFVDAVAQRYHGRIHIYQLWNEPNGNDEWGLQDVNPEAYTALLCNGYRRIKAVDPQAVVLAGALTPTVAMNGRNMNDLIFLERMYQAGAGDCFDVMSAQGYGLWSGPTDQRLRPTVINYPHHLFIRDIMVRHGDAAKPLWISEMAWNAAPDWLPATYGRVTEAQQATYGAEAYQRAQEDWPWLGVINYWFFKRPADYEKDQSWYYFRVMEPDFTPLPVYTALSDYANNPTATVTPDWVLTWMGIRPALFILSSAVLFFSLLRWLAPKETGDSRLEIRN